MDDGDGHNKEAQKLKEEIDALIEQLKQQQSQGGTGQDNQDKPENEDENQNSGEGDREEEIKEQLQQLQEESHQDREDTLQLYEEMDSNADYNWGGQVW